MPASETVDRSVPVSPTARVVAYAVIYLVWGSTFLAIRVAVGTIPPWTMIGVRSVLAGAMVFAWARLRGAPAPGRMEWGVAILAGSLLFAVGHGLLAWGEQLVSSGQAAIACATIPIWTPLAAWLLGTAARPSRGVLAASGLGFCGVLILFAPSLSDANGMGPLVLAALLLSNLAWAFGTAVSRRFKGASSPVVSAGMQLLAGGLVTAALGAAGASGRSFRSSTSRRRRSRRWPT